MSKTLIMVILDESGSMDKNIKTVLNGFNKFLEEQKKIENDRARLFMLKFNTRFSVLYKGIDINDVPDLTYEKYCPDGGTALFDAIAKGIQMADREQEIGERVILCNNDRRRRKLFENL